MGVGTSGSILGLNYCDGVRIAKPTENAGPGGQQDKVLIHHHALAIEGPSKEHQAADVHVTDLTARIGSILGDMHLARRFELDVDGCRNLPALSALSALAEQSVNMGIDYCSLGLGWHHPRSRMEYRSGSHPSQMADASRERACESQRSLIELSVAILEGKIDMESGVTKAFVREIGLSPEAAPALSATFSGVAAALTGELLLPLRALNEGLLAQNVEVRTMNDEVVAKNELRWTVEALTGAVLSKSDGFAEWRYSNSVGSDQLRGLSVPQVRQWQHPFAVEHAGGIRTHEDATGELGFFWATKIGGPSHGFDYEGHCVLPLLANARHKAIFVSDSQWTHFPAGRAHFRLLWTADDEPSEPSQPPDEGLQPSSPKLKPRLWLEGLHRDIAAEQQGIGVEVQFVSWLSAVLQHAISKANAMHVALSVNVNLASLLRHVVENGDSGGCIYDVCERMVLRPSNGVVEASDELGSKHDWTQLAEEVTEPLQRTLYVPPVDGRPVSEPLPPPPPVPPLPPVRVAEGRRSRVACF